MARFNEAVARQQRNIAARNIAQQQNLATRQRIAEQNVQQSNVELQRQRAAEQQMYDNQLRVAQMRAQARLGQAGQYQQQAQQTAGMWSGMGSSVGQGLMYAGIYGGKGSNKPEQPSSGMQAWHESQPRPVEQPLSALERQQQQEAMDRFNNPQNYDEY